MATVTSRRLPNMHIYIMHICIYGLCPGAGDGGSQHNDRQPRGGGTSSLSRKRSAERCLLASGLLSGAFVSWGTMGGAVLQTPWLAEIKYNLEGCREEVLPRRERPTQACLDTWLHPPWQQKPAGVMMANRL